jgi:hypothetical protein
MLALKAPGRGFVDAAHRADFTPRKGTKILIAPPMIESTSLVASELIALAFREREARNFERAKMVMADGLQRFPDELDSFGHPTFAKELLRTLLDEQKWEEAKSLTSQSYFPAAEHWHDLLFARAYGKAGDLDAACLWYNRTYQRYPSAWQEVEEWFRKSERPISPIVPLEARSAISTDLKTARQFVRYGTKHTSATVARFFDNASAASKEKAASTLFKLIDRSELKHAGVCQVRNRSIPRICHRIWVTNPANPTEPPKQMVKRMIENSNSAFGQDWRHILWVQDRALIPQTVALIESQNERIEIRSIYSDLLQDKPMEIAKLFLAQRKHAFAADVLRLKCMYEYGGLYVDIGICFNVPADDLILDFEYVFLLWQNLFFQNSLLAMPKGAALANLCLGVLAGPSYFPRYLFDRDLHGNSDLSLISGPAITVLFFLAFPVTVEAGILISNRQCVSHSAQNSWYSPSADKSAGRLGGVITEHTIPTIARESTWMDVESVFFGNIRR